MTYGTADRQELIELDVAPGTTLIEAVKASGITDLFAEIDLESLVQAKYMGVFGNIDAPDRVLNEWDRVEIYRPLLIDPKEARRQRAEKQKNNS